MLRRICTFLLFCMILVEPASAQNRFIARSSGGLLSLKSICALLGCSVGGSLGDPSGQVFLVTTPSTVNPGTFLSLLSSQPGITDAEIDQLLKVMGAPATSDQTSSTPAVPPALYDTTPVNYYGTTVWHGYIGQPAYQIVRIDDARNTFKVVGQGTVAVIDTGVDPNQPVLINVLVPGYDFTRNSQGGSEMGDVNQSVAAVLDQAQPAWVNQSVAAVLDQSTAAVLDGSQYAAFGHGTMVAGIVHLVAPRALIMPLKAFKADGSGYASDVLRAIYYAAKNGANIINMSFSFPTYSPEVAQAVNYAYNNGLILVASAGNDGMPISVYPASLSNVMGVGSTADDDTRAPFSNYGSQVVWVAAPGMGVVTTYPWGAYAAVWGTSFSTPFVSGGAALLLDVKGLNESQAAAAVANASWNSTQNLGNGRIDLYQALQAWVAALGM